MSSEPIVVVVVRDPDAPHEITVYGADRPVTTVDVDLGYMSMADPDEFAQWAAGMIDEIRTLPDAPRWAVAQAIRVTAESHDHDLPEALAEVEQIQHTHERETP